MYGKAAVGGGLVLPITGVGVVGYVVLGFTLVCVGLALYKMVPRFRRNHA